MFISITDPIICNCMMLGWGWSHILTKFRAIIDLVRANLVFGAGIFVVAGEIPWVWADCPLCRLPSWDLPSGLFISGSANISNDYFDRKADRINQQWRPLPPAGSGAHLELRLTHRDWQALS
jgi:hypothetical protein